MIRFIWSVRWWESECGLTDLPASGRIRHRGCSMRSCLLEALILKLRIQDSAGLRPGWQAREPRRICSVVNPEWNRSALKQKGLLGQSKTFSGTVGSSSCVVRGELWRQSIRSRARLLRPVSFYSSTRDDPSLKRSFILRTVHSRTDRPNRHLINLLARTRRPEAARRPLQGPRAHTELRRTLCSDIGFCEDTDTRIGVRHFLATQYLRTKGIKPQFPNGIVSSVSFVSTTNTARSLAGFVLLALALTTWRSPGSSEKLCPAL